MNGILHLVSPYAINSHSLILLPQIALKTMLLYLEWQKVLAPNNLQGSCLL